MDTSLSDFVWHVAPTGYELDRSTGALLIAEREPLHSASAMRTYHPLREHTGLFRRFSETKPTPAGFVAFANQYGLLGLSGDTAVRLSGNRRAEYHTAWQTAIVSMRVLLTMWDLIETRNARTLRQYVRWRKGSPISSQRFSVRVDSGVKPVEPLIMLEGGILRRDDVITPAREYVRQQVNVELAETNTAQLNWTSDGSRVRLTYAPETLIGAMWLQFALAISAPKEFRSCRTCGSPFEVSREPTTGRRVDSVFCSDRCKSRDYRARRRQARMLVAEGMSVREVATRVGARVAAVQRWIAQDEERD